MRGSSCDQRALEHSDDDPAVHAERFLVVVAASAYRRPLEPWLARRRAQGFHIEVIDPATSAGPGDCSAAVAELAKEIDRRHQHFTKAVPSATGFVLIVGDAPGPGEAPDATRLVPTEIVTEQARPTAPKRFASDNAFALPDATGRPRLAVGRWPVRSPEEVAIQVAKSLRYESAREPGPHRRNVTFLATSPNYDPVWDPVLEQLAMGVVNANVRPRWGLRALYASARSSYFPGPEETCRQVVRWLEDATPMTLFAGHGFDRGVDYVRYEGKLFTVLDAEVAARVNGDRPGTVLWVSACSCGDFDLDPPHRGLAEALMMNPRGPTAVVAGTDETSAWVNLLLCLGLARDVIDDAPRTLGEAFVRFKHAAFKPGPAMLTNLLKKMEPIERPEFSPTDHQYLYNLLGDPTIELQIPQSVSVQAEVEERPALEPGQKRFLVSGKVDDWQSGSVSLVLALDRLAMKSSGPDLARIGLGAERDAAYFDRFHMANDKRVAEIEVPIRDGLFEAELRVPELLVSKVRWLQMYLQSTKSPDGTWSDGIAAQPIRLVRDEN